MPEIIDIERRKMVRAFEETTRTYDFLRNMATDSDDNVSDTRTVSLDILRANETIAVDIRRGAGARSSDDAQFTSKTYEPPFFNEKRYFTAEQLFFRTPGMDPWKPRAQAGMRQTIVKAWNDFSDKMARATEKQVSDALFAGQIVLTNGDVIDFKQKATHQIVVGTPWSTTSADASGDIAGAALLNRTDGRSTSDVLIFGDTAWDEFQKNDDIIVREDLLRANTITINRPLWMESGGVFHGFVTIGSYEMECWTFPQFYDVPLGFGLPNEGTTVPYIPTDKVYVGSSKARFDIYHAGLPEMVPVVDPTLRGIVAAIPQTRRGRFLPYAVADMDREALKIGLKSAPLFVPTAIDTFSILST